MIARMKQAIYDQAGTWEHTFPEGNTGDVVGAPDAAVVAARTAFDMLYERGLLREPAIKPQVCTCPLIDVSTGPGGVREFVRGRPDGCAIHEDSAVRTAKEAARNA